MANGSQNGWNEYSRLVLNELESLAGGIDSLRSEVQELKQELTKMQVREDRVEELRAWKSNVDEVASPTQLKEALVSVQELQNFKTKAITVFAVVQFAMATALALMKL
tara:strand:- start:193 stop:516 length:324 start_codon:yes stop_codon:yes gene_type:complete